MECTSVSIRLLAACLCLLAAQRPALAQHLDGPANLAVTPNGQLFVESTNGNAIVTFQTDGTYVGSFSTGTGQPYRLAIDKNQDLFVGMLNSADVSVYSLAGTLLRTIAGANGTSLGVTSADDLLSIQTAALEVFNKQGKLTETITQDKQGRRYDGGANVVIGTAMYYVSGPATGRSIADTVSVASILAGLPREREHFTNTGSPMPTQVAVDGAGHYYVVGATGALTVYSHPGALLLSITGLASPGGVAVDTAGNIYVGESAANDIKVFNAAGSLINTIQ